MVFLHAGLYRHTPYNENNPGMALVFLALKLHNSPPDFTEELEVHDLRHEIETHPALLGLLAAVVRENGYSVQYNLKWGFRWVEVSHDCNTEEASPRFLCAPLLVASSTV